MPVIQSFSSFPPSPHNQSAEFSVSIGGNLTVKGQSSSGATFRVKIGGDVRISGAFVFEIPPPILDEPEENAFALQIYTARLLDEYGNEILITDAVKDQPKGEIGERISLTVGRKDLSIIAPDKTYTFQIGRWENLQDAIGGEEPEWETVCDNAGLNSRSFSIGRNGKRPNDNLTFDIVESNKNRLNYFPPRNYILYDSLQVNVETDDIERTYTSSGDYVKTTANAFPNLTFYKILDFIKERCGFSGINARLPNFPVIRADFPFDMSYAQSLAGIAGMYQPIFSVEDNVLIVKTKFAELPDDFEPNALTINDYRQLSLQIAGSTRVDGIRLVYIYSNASADYYDDRLVQTSEQTGDFGDEDYTRTDINRTYRDWYFTEQPDAPVRTELIREVHSTYNASLDLIGRETNDYNYDAQGKRTSSHREIESRVPDLADDGNLLLMTVRDERQTVFYTTDSRNPKRQIQSKNITQISGMISVDASNQYFDQDFTQDYLEAHKAGNLTTDMTSYFGAIKTITETLTSLGNNQFEVRISAVDHLRGATVNSVSEPKTGDASLTGVGGRQRRFVLWADGVSTNSRTGGEILDLVGGELPQSFLLILGEIILNRRLSGFSDGSLQIPGYHKSLNRGVYFRVFDRGGNSLGRFIAEAVNATFSNLGTKDQTVMTTVQISEV